MAQYYDLLLQIEKKQDVVELNKILHSEHYETRLEMFDVICKHKFMWIANYIITNKKWFNGAPHMRLAIFTMLNIACKYELVDIISNIIDTYTLYQNYNEFGPVYTDHIKHVIQRNQIEIIKLLVHKRMATWPGILLRAVDENQSDIVCLAISHGANNINIALRNAYMGDNLDMMALLIKNGAGNYNEFDVNTISKLLNRGCVNANLPYYELLLCHRRYKQVIIKNTLSEINHNGWDHLGLTDMIYEYVPYG